MIYTVYILYSDKYSKTYVGFTSHLILRFHQHNEIGNGWTKRFRPWKVVYCEYFEDKKIAYQREKWLKSGQGRQFIKINIAGWSSW